MNELQLGIDLMQIEEIAGTGMKTVFISCVGSHIRRMDTHESYSDLADTLYGFHKVHFARREDLSNCASAYGGPSRMS